MRSIASLLVLALSACASTGGSHSAVTGPEPAASLELLETLGQLEGSWTGSSPEGSFEVEFRRTAAGSAVIETMMPGTESEMVNLYTVHGDGVNMTHYCSAGNQPHMRATAQDGNRIAFRPTGVSGRQTEDEHYMAEMTLVLVDENRIEQHWGGGEEEAPVMVFELERR